MTNEVDYNPLFNPAALVPASFDAKRILHRGDQPPGGGYVYDPAGRIVLAVNVALATGRPLLVRGKPGSGKSSLAADVARHLKWRYYETTVTSRTRARDLLWRFDAVKRLSDAQGEGAAEPSSYVVPGVFWWAFSPASAARRGLSEREFPVSGLQGLKDPSPRSSSRSVVLVDELDKADPDVPNDLLLPLGSLRFDFTENGDAREIAADHPPLVIITTN